MKKLSSIVLAIICSAGTSVGATLLIVNEANKNQQLNNNSGYEEVIENTPSNDQTIIDNDNIKQEENVVNPPVDEDNAFKDENTVLIANSSTLYGFNSDNLITKAPDVRYSYMYNENKYYVVNMGEITQAPIWSGIHNTYDENQTQMELKMSNTKVDKQSVEETISKTVATAFEVSKSTSVKVSVEAKLEGLTQTLEESESKTITESLGISKVNALSILNGMENTLSQETTRIITGNKYGTYRFALVVDCEIYAVMVIDVNNNLKEINYVLRPIENSDKRLIVEYTSDPRGNFGNDVSKKFTIDSAYINRLPACNSVREINFVNDNTLVNVTDTGYYGLYGKGKEESSKKTYNMRATESKERLNLSKYREFINSNYVFVFNVSIEAYKLDRGYPEIYLYNNKLEGVSTSEEISISTARDTYGMIAGVALTTAVNQTQTAKFSWCVSGDQVTETMFISYDASGSEEDAWRKVSLKIDLDIICQDDMNEQKNINIQLENFVSGVMITDAGAYGSANVGYNFSLEAYEKYFKDEYTFIFDITTEVKEKNDGYIEFCLYKGRPQEKSNNYTLSEAFEKGLVGRWVIEHGAGKVDKTYKAYAMRFYVTGKDVLSEMSIKPDAYGKDDDTYYINSIKVKVSIVKIGSPNNENATPIIE